MIFRGVKAVREKILCVISHTHWDREWYRPQEVFRMRLVDLMNNLLKLLENEPAFIFHLDAQTVVLEDYLEIFPEKKEEIMGYVKEGRLIVGPWYVQNDFYLTSGEATVRNLLVGSKIARSFGASGDVGYVADQFGLISQLPQIFNGFGIRDMIFARGFDHMEKNEKGEIVRKKMPSELLWSAPDGSTVLAVCMTYWYNNAQRISEDMNRATKLLENIEEAFSGVATTPYLLLMNGVDHLEAQENLLPVLTRLREEKGFRISQTTMRNYMDLVRGAVDEEKLIKCETELRYGTDNNLLQGTLSSRVYLKRLNRQAETLLENKLEPLYAYLYQQGGEYPDHYMHYLWKSLIRNHPHDSICGCSVDHVHRQMEDRYERIFDTGEELLTRGLDTLLSHTMGEIKDPYALLLFNTSDTKKEAVCHAELEFLAEENTEAFTLYAPDGSVVPYAVLNREKRTRAVFSPINLPGALDVDHYEIVLDAGELPAMTYRVLSVMPGKAEGLLESRTPENFVLENDCLKAEIKTDGTLCLLDKASGRQWNDLLYFEDSEDNGDSYIYSHGPKPISLTTKGLSPKLRYVRQNDLESVVEMTYCWPLPAELTIPGRERSEELVEEHLKVEVSLKKGSPVLDFHVFIQNRAKDHRLCAVLNTEIDTPYTEASSPFDIICRDNREVLKGISCGIVPNSGVITIKDDEGGMAILNHGLFGYESLCGSRGSIALTLLRATGWVSNPQDFSVKDKVWMAPENQCLRDIEVSFAVSPMEKGESSVVAVKHGNAHYNEILTWFGATDPEKFHGGRPAVQDSEIKEIFNRPDPLAHMVLKREGGLCLLEEKDFICTCYKKAEEKALLVYRFYYIGEEAKEITLPFNMHRLRLDEKILEENITSLFVKPGEIVTLGITTGRNE